MKIFKTIKFKLAIFFSIILFLFSGTIVLFFNIAISNYLSTREQPPNQQQIVQDSQVPNQSIDKDLRSIYSDNLESIQSKSLMSLPILALVSFGLGYFLAGYFLRPLEDLNNILDKLKTDTLGTQIEVIPETEIGKTIISFNEMSSRLKQAFSQQSQFVQDASHELRTPLTIMRTNIETVLDDQNATNDELRSAMQESLTELDSVTNLANDLLTLSRPQSKIRNKEDIFEVVDNCIQSVSELAHKQKVKITKSLPDNTCIVLVNKQEIARAITNILDNAIKYSKSTKDAVVSVSLKTVNKYCVIEISDNGIVIPEKDIDKIFDRFYRVDKSRDKETGGYGLGLPITKKIIEDHLGKISVKSIKGNTTFTVKLPLVTR